ncbi:MAG: hypothetical protein K2Z81_13280 [Cyanobacteria bacterium]|nr:hypothetical protein [Cyanobacteriota bacterium]
MPGPSGLDVSDTMVGNFVRSTFKHALTTNTAAHPLQPEKDPLTLSQWSPDQTGSTSMMAIGGRENYAEPTTTTPIPSPAQAPQSSTKPQAQGFGKASEWENKILIDDVTEVSRMTGLVPGSRDIGSMLPRQSNDDESSVFDQIQSQPRTNNEGSDLLRRQERRTGKPASPAKPHPSDYDPSELESLRTGKSSGKDGKKKGGLGAKIVAFFGIILVVGVMGAVGFSFLSKQMPQERPASFTTAAGVTIRNLSGRWAINLVTTLDNGTANPFQQFEATVEQNNQTLSGSGRDGDGNFIITGEIGEDGKRLTLKKQYEGQSRFHLPIMMSGEVADPSTPAVGNGHFYAHISDQSGQQVRVTGEWQAQLSINQPKALF